MSALEKKTSAGNSAKIIVKEPSQARSRQTVTAILDACARLLISEGFYEVTTDGIAKEANVSIGSLYQFFGNKESIVQALVKRVTEEDMAFAAQRMEMLMGKPPEQRIEAVVALAFEMSRQKEELRAKLVSIQYYVADASYLAAEANFYADLVKKILPQMSGRSVEKIAFVLVQTIIGALNNMRLNQDSALHDPEIEKEMTLLVKRYLNP